MTASSLTTSIWAPTSSWIATATVCRIGGESKYFYSSTNGDPNNDSDGDGLLNLQEYAEYGSNPIATPIYVDDDAPGDPGPGDPAVSDPLEDGTSPHPFDEIQEGLQSGRSRRYRRRVRRNLQRCGQPGTRFRSQSGCSQVVGRARYNDD